MLLSRAQRSLATTPFVVRDEEARSPWKNANKGHTN